MRTTRLSCQSRSRMATRAIVTAILSIGMSLTTPNATLADTADDIRQLTELESERSAASVDLENAASAANGTQEQLDSLSKQIDQIEKDIVVDRASLSEQMRAAYKMGSVSGWDAILSSDTIDDMLSTADYSSKIRSQNLEIIQTVMDSTRQLHELRDEADALYAEQASNCDRLQGELDDIDSQIEELSEKAEVRLKKARMAIARKAVSLAGTASPEPYIAGGEFEVPTDPRLENYLHEKERVYPGDPWWASCCRVAATAIKASGIDEDWPLGAPADMYVYASQASDRWKMVGTWNVGDSSEVLEPGDVLITMGNHIKIFVGNDLVREKFPDSDANMYSGSAGQHQPWCYDESTSHDYREYGIFRFIGDTD